MLCACHLHGQSEEVLAASDVSAELAALAGALMAPRERLPVLAEADGTTLIRRQ